MTAKFPSKPLRSKTGAWWPMFVAAVLVIVGLPIMIGAALADSPRRISALNLYRTGFDGDGVASVPKRLDGSLSLSFHLFRHRHRGLVGGWTGSLGAGAKTGGAECGARHDTDDAAGAAWVCPP